MRNTLILMCLLTNVSFGQNLRPLSYEFERCNVETALIWTSQAIDEYPIWSSDEKNIAVNEMGIWRKISLQEVFFNEAKWLGNKIGQNISESAEDITETEINEYTKATIFDPRKIETKDGHIIELRMSGFQTEFIVDQKKLWQTGGDNCHSLALSPDGNYVAFISESNGLMIYCINKDLCNEQVPEYVKRSSKAINALLKGRIKTAQKIWNEIIQTNEHFSEPLFWIGLIELSNGNDSLAISYIDKAIAIDPGTATYYFTKASIYQLSGNTDRAIENYKMYIQVKPTDLYGYYYLAELYQSIGDNSNACEYFKLAKKYHSRRAQKLIDELCN